MSLLRGLVALLVLALVLVVWRWPADEVATVDVPAVGRGPMPLLRGDGRLRLRLITDELPAELRVVVTGPRGRELVPAAVERDPLVVVLERPAAGLYDLELRDADGELVSLHAFELQ